MRHGHMIKGQQGRNDASSLSHHLLRERVIIIIILREKKHIGKNINTHSKKLIPKSLDYIQLYFENADRLLAIIEYLKTY